MKNLPTRSQLKVGDFVKIEQKHNRNTGHLNEGIIEEILTRGEEHPYGIMVLLTDGKIGRVKEKLEHEPKATDVDDLLKDQFTGVAEMKVHQKEPVNIEIPKKEDITNEFKETFRFDTKEFKLRNAGQNEAADGRKKEVKKIEEFYYAEDYHQDFEKKNPYNPYVQNVSIPRFKKFKKKSSNYIKIKDDHK